MSNPRNKVSSEPKAVQRDGNVPDPSEWKFMKLGSMSVRNGRDLVREHDVSFTINLRNAEILKDLCQYVLDKNDNEERISINASPFYEGAATENTLKYFSHRVYISAETIAKTGKSFADYFKKD